MERDLKHRITELKRQERILHVLNAYDCFSGFDTEIFGNLLDSFDCSDISTALLSVAKAEAGMLNESLGYTSPETLSNNEIVLARP
jgi:hypothetical protein